MQDDILSVNLNQLLTKFKTKYPTLISIALESKNKKEFYPKFLEYININVSKRTADKFIIMLKNDGRTIYELSKRTHIKLETIELFWKFLSGKIIDINISTDIFLDLYHILSDEYLQPDIENIKAMAQRWPKGTDSGIMQIMEDNKERIIHLLINKLRSFDSKSHSKFYLPQDLSYSQKYSLVKEWWNNHSFQLAMAIKNPKELNLFLSNSLTDETMQLLQTAYKKGMPFFVTPYYLSLLNIKQNGYNDLTVRSYIIYSKELIKTYGNIEAWEREDLLEHGKPNAAGWLLPEGDNIHRRYPDVAILIPDTMGRSCGGLCAPCQRMYNFQNKNLNFNLDKLSPKESWKHKLERLMDYFENDTQIRDILITGGDALMSQNKSLKRILDSIYNMAIRKRENNMSRMNGEKYAEIQRVRIGTRLLAYLPMRIDNELIDILKEFKEKGKRIGIEQFIIQTHFQSPLEITVESKNAIERILSSGWIITNQLVYTVAASRRGHNMRLREILNSLGILCYYTFTVKGFYENYDVFTPNSRSLQEQKEEKILGRLDCNKSIELKELLSDGINIKEKMDKFLFKNNMSFIATDRNVLNLPAIGKSMTFKLVGIDKSGRRILKFSHDHTRKHSPIIEKMGDVYIIENKSIASYLRQLKNIGENIDSYSSIWQYTSGETEPCFPLYKYPSYNYSVTSRISNIVL